MHSTTTRFVHAKHTIGKNSTLQRASRLGETHISKIRCPLVHAKYFFVCFNAVSSTRNTRFGRQSRTEPTRAVPSRAELRRAGPGRAEPGRAGPSSRLGNHRPRLETLTLPGSPQILERSLTRPKQMLPCCKLGEVFQDAAGGFLVRQKNAFL